jgi:hypothetical protein
MDVAFGQGARRRHSGDYGDDEQRGPGATDALGRYGFGCYRPLVPLGVRTDSHGIAGLNKLAELHSLGTRSRGNFPRCRRDA